MQMRINPMNFENYVISQEDCGFIILLKEDIL